MTMNPSTGEEGLWCKMSGVGENGKVSRFVSVDELFAGRHFDAEIVVLCVRWYFLAPAPATLAARLPPTSSPPEAAGRASDPHTLSDGAPWNRLKGLFRRHVKSTRLIGRPTNL
jgi:hypothetical protein